MNEAYFINDTNTCTSQFNFPPVMLNVNRDKLCLSTQFHAARN